MDLTSVLGAVLGGSKSNGGSGLDLGKVLQTVLASKSNSTSSSNTFNPLDIVKQLGGAQGSGLVESILKGIVAKQAGQQISANQNIQQQPATGTSMNDIANMAQGAAVILKSIFGNKA